MNNLLTNTDNDVRIKRLRYRSWHRGCKETDIVLGRFADERLTSLDEKTLDTFEKMLDEDDVDIWNWLIGKSEPELPAYRAMIELLKGYTIPTT